MSAALPANATSPGSQSVSPKLPDSWVEKLFQKFEDFYGAKWAAQYGNFPRERIKRTWAEELGGFASMPGGIANAIDAQKSSVFPPTLPEFLALCRTAGHRIGNAAPLLEHKLTSEDHERAKSAAASAAAALKPKFSDGIDTHWATHPRTPMHLDFIFGAAKNDARFRRCIEKMVADGICTSDGRMLKTYRDGVFA